jgi:nicotinamide-nucleotide amidase
MFNSKLIDRIKENLIGRNEKLSVAESVTAGFLQAAMASAEMALKFFEGGITTYNINQKVMHLGIDKKKGEECNCVSEQTANEMALGVCELFGTEWGIAITGYATSVPESDFKLFAWFSICCKGKIILAEKIDLKNQKAEDAQLEYVNIIIEKFIQILE